MQPDFDQAILSADSQLVVQLGVSIAQLDDIEEGSGLKIAERARQLLARAVDERHLKLLNPHYVP